MQSNEAWLSRLKAVECPDSTYWHAKPPLVFERALGSEIWDVQGKRYIDLCAGFGVMALGHASVAQQKVFRETFDTDLPLIVHGMGDVYPSRAKIELIERLVSVLPSHLDKVALALSGAQAVELALKTALLATGRNGVIVFDGGYHGLELGVLALTAREDFRTPFRGWLPEENVVRLPFGCDVATLNEAKAELERRGQGLAAIVTEPIQGRAGMVVPPPGWLASLRLFADRESALLIFDEVFTGLGRTGRWSFADEVPPDLLCLGKSLGGGLPLSACIGRARVMQAWPESSGEAIHTGTFFGHPLACRMGSEILSTIADQRLCERAATFGETMRARIAEMLQGVPSVAAVRGQGLFIGIEFDKPGLGAEMMDRLREKGVIALASGGQGEALAMTPALNIDEELWLEALMALRACLD